MRIDGRALNRYGLSPAEFTVYLALLSRADRDGIIDLKRLPTSLSRRSIRRHLHTLERARLVARNPWRLLPVTAWLPSARLESCRKHPPRGRYTGNAYGEWRNADEHPGLLEFLSRRNPRYEESIAYLRTRDRSNNKRANEWWGRTEARAHLINAVLKRGQRRVEQVEREALLPKGKLYYYLKSFELSFRMRPDGRTFVIFYDGTLHEAFLIEEYSGQRALLEIRHHDHVEQHYGRWSPSSWAYRLYHRKGRAPRTVPIHQAARHCRVSTRGMRAIMYRIGYRKHQTVPLHIVEQISGRPWGLSDED